MRLVRYELNGRIGVAVGRGAEFRGFGQDEAGFPGDWDSVLSDGGSLRSTAKRLFDEAPLVDKNSVRFLPPLGRPGKIICIGLNYREHSAEFGREMAGRPEIFARFTTTLAGHQSPLIKPYLSDQLDYEGELAVVIGRVGRHILPEKALEHVAAYSIFNDGSVRDYQMYGSQWMPGKNFDSTGGFGPWLVTAEDLPPGAGGLSLQTRVNGQIRQQANTSDLIWDVAALIAYLSRIMTLVPGDLIITGTPGGVGQASHPQFFLKPGDICEVEIEGIGILENPVAAEAQ